MFAAVFRIELSRLLLQLILPSFVYACHDYNKLHIDPDEYGLFAITYKLIMVKIS